MPKEKTSKSAMLRQWIQGEPTLTTDGKVILCQVCNKHLSCEKKFQVIQHLKTALHTKNALKGVAKKQVTLETICTNSDNDQNIFWSDMCKALVSANIPLKKLNNKEFRKFLEKYCERKIPDESTLRKGYLDSLYIEVMQSIRDDIGECNIWLSVDETTDSCGRYIANVVVGKLCAREPGTPHLIMSKVLEKANHGTIARLVHDAQRILWPTEERDRFAVMLTDAAAYMIKAAKALQIFHPKMIHVTCLAHGLHRVAEEVRHRYPAVNAVIASTKKVFVKAPSRVQLFKEMCPETPLPPEPILTRWGTWIQAALYYCNHLDDVKKVLDMLDKDEAASIPAAVSACSASEVQGQLAYIKAHFEELPVTITRLEKVGLSLSSAFEIYDSFTKKRIPGEVGEAVARKIENVQGRNPGIIFFREINEVLLGTSRKEFSNYSAAEISSFMFTPLTSCDVERSFSSFKNILTDKRKCLIPENLEKYLIVYCYCNGQ